MQYLLLLCLILFALTTPLFAQETDETSNHLYSAWTVTDLLADDDDAAIEDYVVFLQVDDDTLLEVWSGADVVYTLEADGSYSGTSLLPDDYEFLATLTFIDEDTIETYSEINAGFFTSTRNLLYQRTDMLVGVWIEAERDLQEYSMFGECMGRVDTSPPRAFSEPDPILTIHIDEEAGELVIGKHVLTGSGTYELEEESEFGQFIQVVTQTAVVTEDTIDFTYHAIADGRDDCELIYETQYLPFDADYEAFFELVDSLVAGSE